MPKLQVGKETVKFLAIFDHLNLQPSTFNLLSALFEQLPFPGTFFKPFASH
jgi:hypothetical protein